MALPGGVLGRGSVIVASWEELLAGRTAAGDALRDRPARLTIGVFDGLHLGHRRLMEAITAGAGDAAEGPLPVVITFRRPPGQVLTKSAEPGLILSLQQRLLRFALLGVGAVVLIDFSEELSTLAGREFIDLLRGRLAIERIVVGPNFRFGRNRDADVRDLDAMLEGSPTTVQVVEPVSLGGSVVSSSRIRRSVRAGRLDEAAAMLTVPHEVDLAGVRVVRGERGALSMRREDVPQVLPQAGTFAVTGRSAEGGVPGTLTAAEESVVVRLEREADVTALTFGRGEGKERSPFDGTDH
jgi:FAD synthase